MKYCRCKHFLIVAMCILIVVSIGITGCADTVNANVIPIYEGIKQIPEEITTAQIGDDYATDPVAADDKYKGKRFCFYNVEVQEVDENSTKRYFITDKVKFVLNSLSMMQNVEPGFVLNLTGECQGLLTASRDIITINYCWVESVIGDLGMDEWVDTY